MWSRATKIRVLVGILAALVLVVGLAIWMAVRSGKLPEAAQRVARDLAQSAPRAEKAQRELAVELEKIKAAGEPMTLDEIIPPEVPDEENAAVVYQKAFEKLNLSEEDKDVLGDLLSSTTQPPRGEAPSMETIEQIVAKNAAAIALLEKAAQRPRCRFPVDWEAGTDARFPHFGKLRDCAKLLSAQAVLEVRGAEVTGAFHTVEIGLAMGEALRQEPLQSSQIVRYGIASMLLDSLRLSLARGSPPTQVCRGMFAYLGQMQFSESFANALLGERAVGVWAFDYVREDPQRLADILEEDSKFVRTLAGTFGPILLNQDEAVYLKLMSEQIAAARKPYRESHAELAEMEERFDEEVDQGCVLTCILFPVFHRGSAKRDETIAEVGLTQVALALKAYKNEKGRYPESLAKLREVIDWGELPEDPFSGKDFVYRREGEGFLVYSIGQDLQDDGGLPERDAEGYRRDDSDIVWECRR